MKLKEKLTEIGLTEELAQKVIDEVVDGNFVPKSRFNEINEELKTAKKSISDRDKQLEDLKKASGDNEDLQKQISDLQKANADQKKAHEKEIADLKRENAIEAALTAAGAKNMRAVKSLIDMEKVSLGEDGKLAGFEDQLSEIQKSDGYLFETAQKKGTFKGFQPGAAGDIKPGGGIDTSKMSYEELCAYLEENPNATLPNE